MDGIGLSMKPSEEHFSLAALQYGTIRKTSALVQRGFVLISQKVAEFDHRTHRTLWGMPHGKIHIEELASRCQVIRSTRRGVLYGKKAPWDTSGSHLLIVESANLGPLRINMEVGSVGNSSLASLTWRLGEGSTSDLSSESEFASRLIEASLDVVISVDNNRRLVEFNSTAERIFGYTKSEVLGKPADFLYYDPAQGRQIESEIKRIGRWEGEVVNLRNNGEAFVSYLSASTVVDNGGSVVGVIGISRDLTQERKREQQIHDLNLKDELTGLPNRKSFKFQVWQELQPTLGKGTTAALAILDIDRLKLVNDSIGHEAGDEVIKTVAERLRQATPERGLLARLGGDEFGIFVKTTGSSDDAVRLVSDWITVVSEPLWVTGLRTQVSASTGVAFLGTGTDLDAETLLKRADTAMYEAKANGGGRLEVYRDELGNSATLRFQIEHHLKGALKRAEMTYLLQPKWEIRSGKAVGAELLLRWNSPDLGPISPSKFIPVAESSAQICAIGEWAIECAAHEIRKIQNRCKRPFRLAVNVSANQIIADDFAQKVMDIFSREKVSLSLLEIEITENVLLPEAPRVSQNIQALTDKGVRFLIDDFGTGFSSLSYLRKFPFHSLKIDKSFVSQLQDNCGDLNLISAIVSVARALNCDVVAEGVETENQLAKVTELGCHYAQGFYLSKPIESKALLELLDSPSQQ